jgi:thioredoxin reductase
MALYMDIHNVPGVTSGAAAEAHAKDLQTQAKHEGVDYMRYWVDEQAGKIFCLVQAPNAEAAHAVHREAHGLVADEIFEVREGS